MANKKNELKDLKSFKEIIDFESPKSKLEDRLREVEKKNFFIFNGSKLTYVLLSVLIFLFWYYLHFRFDVVSEKINTLEKIIDLKIENINCNDKRK